MMTNSHLTSVRLRAVVNYDAMTGIFTAKVRRGKILPGAVLGVTCERGLITFMVDGRLYRAHRLAWLYVYGNWPIQDLDHADGNPSNNRIANLREATDSQNLGNCKRPITNKSGRKGVSWHKGGHKWQVHIRVENKNYYLGLFDNLDAAHSAYASAAVQHRGEFARFD